MQVFYSALVAVTEPKLTDNTEAKTFEYDQDAHDNTSLNDIKRIRRHLNTKDTLKKY